MCVHLELDAVRCLQLEGRVMAEKKREQPAVVRVTYRGIAYSLDLIGCRRALVKRQIEGDVDSMESLAAAIGRSRSTVSRFFSGRPTSLAVTLSILSALRLTFDDVASAD